MFGWLDKIAEAIFRRGRGLVEVSDHLAEEKRTAMRAVRDAIRDAMVEADNDREHGVRDAGKRGMTAARLASATAREIDDQEARDLVEAWWRRFDAIPKGWKKQAMYESPGRPLGYPEPAWTELKQAADAAQDRLGELLRALMEPK